MRLISWNVNGIRAAVKKGFLDYLANEEPDILCIQESKAHKEQVVCQALCLFVSISEYILRNNQNAFIMLAC